MRIEEFDYLLPKEMVAQYPAEDRPSSRLLVFDRKKGAIEHRRFVNIGEYLREGDLLVLNDSRVFPAKLTARKETGGKVEILLVEKKRPDMWKCLSRDIKKGSGELNVSVGPYRGVIQEDDGSWMIRFLHDGDSDDIIAECGKMPLPPYIKRTNGNGAVYDTADYERYQTVYADKTGSIAAPTAGFHFSQALLDAIEHMGVQVLRITLHIGIGTFSLIRSDTVEGHAMHGEFYELDEAKKRIIEKTKSEGRRVIACGTSAVRTLETVFSENGDVPLSGFTELFIYPGYQFKVVDALITNFHVPRSTPLLLASAFAGHDALMGCYNEAMAEGYRFYSYGDSMFIV